MTKLLVPLWLALTLAACDYSNKNNTTKTDVLITCKEPRPQICTREYNPVCATLKDDSTQTMVKGCTACSNDQITVYEMGECK